MQNTHLDAPMPPHFDTEVFFTLSSDDEDDDEHVALPPLMRNDVQMLEKFIQTPVRLYRIQRTPVPTFGVIQPPPSPPLANTTR